MHSLQASEPSCNVPMDTIEDAHQVRELITGLVGLLRHPHRTDDVDKARGVALTALATVDRLVAHLDAVAAIQGQRERAEQAHRAESARVAAVAGAVKS